MNYLDTLYRAFLEYRKETKEHNFLKKQRKSVAKASEAEDKIEITRTKCIIESDWIEAIEEGLIYVEKAIREERQFIRSNGEVVPIEKAKNVGKESVEHLARHSQLLTKEPVDGGDIIPDQIYTVERLTDFAVYENRFLYMLLCYLKDFIALRYNKILDLTNTYNGNMTMNKVVLSDKSKINYSVTLKEERKDDEYLKAHNDAKDIIQRIDLIYKVVMRFLSTPLMDEVAKAPMLRPPITKTNVLKMNNNFKRAVALYEYVSSYSKEGFSIERTVKTLHPFNEELADEISESVILSSFLTYYHGLGIKEYLKENYEEENRIRRELEAQKKEELLKRLQRQVREAGGDPYEYILELESRVKSLKSECEDYAKVRKELAEKIEENEYLTKKTESLEEQVATLIKEHEEKVAELIQTHSEEIDSLNTAHSEYVEQLCKEHADTVEEMKRLEQENIERITAEHEEEVASIKQTHEEEIETINKTFDEEVERLNATFGETIRELREKASALSLELAQTISDTKNEMQKLRNQHAYEIGVMKNEAEEKVKSYNKLWDDHTLLKARYNAIRKETGKMTDPNEFATRDAFDDIEHQYEVFKKFFKGEWKVMKKRIRHDVFEGFGSEVKAVLKDGKTDATPQQTANKEVAVTEEKPQTPPLSTEETPKEEKIVDESKEIALQEEVEQKDMREDLTNNLAEIDVQPEVLKNSEEVNTDEKLETKEEISQENEKTETVDGNEEEKEI